MHSQVERSVSVLQSLHSKALWGWLRCSALLKFLESGVFVCKVPTVNIGKHYWAGRIALLCSNPFQAQALSYCGTVGIPTRLLTVQVGS